MFWKRQPPPFDPEKYIGHLLTTLPRCTRRVVIFDESIDESFSCTYVVYAEDLLLWLEDHFTKVFVTNIDKRAAEKAFLLWLASADQHNDETLIRIPGVFYESYGSYASKLVSAIAGEILCPTCGAFYPKISVDFENVQSSGPWHASKEVWRCSNGHVLRHINHRVHMLKRE